MFCIATDLDNLCTTSTICQHKTLQNVMKIKFFSISKFNWLNATELTFYHLIFLVLLISRLLWYQVSNIVIFLFNISFLFNFCYILRFYFIVIDFPLARNQLCFLGLYAWQPSLCTRINEDLCTLVFDLIFFNDLFCFRYVSLHGL